MIAIISDNERETFGTRLFEYFTKQQEKVVLIPVSNRDIKPCYSCSGCNDKTFGKCVVRDDMDEILPIMARADKMVYTTPIQWGQTSYDIKKVLDKSSLLGNRFYKMRGKEIVKGTAAGNSKMAVIGISEKPADKAKRTFLTLAKEIANITDSDYIAKVMKPDISEEELVKTAKEVLAL